LDVSSEQPLDVLANGAERDAPAAAELDRLELAGTEELVEGGAADAEHFGGLLDSE
jgi:hypothetical protein